MVKPSTKAYKPRDARGLTPSESCVKNWRSQTKQCQASVAYAPIADGVRSAAAGSAASASIKVSSTLSENCKGDHLYDGPHHAGGGSRVSNGGLLPLVRKFSGSGRESSS